MSELEALLSEIRNCRLCKDLPLGPNPVLKAAESAKILIVGQAPGVRVHNTSIPWNDPSGDRLRDWMGVDKEIFYDESKIAIVPMGFCYPGTGKSGDLPPRKLCSETWHEQLLSLLPNIELTLLFGQYATSYFLGKEKKKNLTQTVRAYEEYMPRYLPMPHPSPRNRLWLKKNEWFELDIVPILKLMTQSLLEKER